MFKRKLYCTNCSKEIEDDEGIYAKMKAPKHSIMVEIKAYLKKKVKFTAQTVLNRLNNSSKQQSGVFNE